MFLDALIGCPLRHLHYSMNMLRQLHYSYIFLLFVSSALHAKLVNGPMIAHIEMREAKIWVQTDRPCIVRVVYSAQKDGNSPLWTNQIKTDSNKSHTAVVTLDQVEPGQNYTYQVEINGEIATEKANFSILANYYEREPAPDFKIAVGGAHYMLDKRFEPPYRTLGAGYKIFSSIAKIKPALMIWTGNTAHLRESDWGSVSGYQKRFTQARSSPYLKELLNNLPQYATWSTHDYGAPNSGRNSAFRSIAEKTFETFWPRPVEIEGLDGVATQFRYADVDFFMLDVLSYRNDKPLSESRPQILGQAQIKWLRQALIQSTATFKVIIAGAPILNPADSMSNLSYADGEHTQLLQILRDARISGLFFLSGGKSYGELTRLVHANSYNLYDLTLGPLTAVPGDNEDELNFFRQPGTSTYERHFAVIEFSGTEETRALTIRIMDIEGRELWYRTIPASSLQPTD